MVENKEIWKSIKKYPNYEVSNWGKVKNINRGREVKSSPNTWGYLGLFLYNAGERKRYSVHRLVAKAFVENNEGKEEVNHIDGNKMNNHFTNLEWVTRSENMEHAQKKGLLDMTRAYTVSPKTKGKQICVYDKEKGIEIIFKNGATASRHFGFTESYFSKIITFGDGESERFKVRYLQEYERVEISAI